MKISLLELGEVIREKLNIGSITSTILLGRSRFIDEDSRMTAAFSDPAYLPFYYHLGHFVEAQSLMEIGFRLGLPSTCFLQGCKTVKNFFGFREEQSGAFYSPRLARGNIKDYFRANFPSHIGLITDAGFLVNVEACLWDVVLVDEEVNYDKHMAYLDLIWPRMAGGGIIVVDYLNRHEPSRLAFEDFASTHNRIPLFLSTRYGVGIIQR